MRPLYEDFDELDFGDSDLVQKILREQEREERRMASRRRRGSSAKYTFRPIDEFEDYGSPVDFEEIEYDDYDEDEFDRYSGINIDH